MLFPSRKRWSPINFSKYNAASYAFAELSRTPRPRPRETRWYIEDRTSTNLLSALSYLAKSLNHARRYIMLPPLQTSPIVVGRSARILASPFRLLFAFFLWYIVFQVPRGFSLAWHTHRYRYMVLLFHVPRYTLSTKYSYTYTSYITYIYVLFSIRVVVVFILYVLFDKARNLGVSISRK